MSAAAAQVSSTPVYPAGRQVKLFLADGTAQGIVIADLGNWPGKILVAPRSRLRELLSRDEAARTGIYLLTGPDPDQPDGILVYIGEADNVAARMRIHLRSEAKDFFDRLTFIVTADDSLDKLMSVTSRAA